MESPIGDGLPDLFCWTRFGGEAAEPVEYILQRKEKERLGNGGIFLWGIGNAIGPSIVELMHRTARPKVVFSPIKSRPRAHDMAPPSVVRWTEAETLGGVRFPMPKHSLVTSRFDPESPKNYHFALVCFSSTPILPLQSKTKVGFRQLCNLRTGRPVAASQVTAVVELRETETYNSSLYDVAILADLVGPCLIRLQNACKVSSYPYQ